MKTTNIKFNFFGHIRFLSSTSISLLFLIIILTCGCKKFIEIPPSSDQLVTSSVFNNNAAATSAVTDIYTQMWRNAESAIMAQNNGLLGDELTEYNTSPGINYQEYINSMFAESPASNSFGPWINGYNYIYQANAVISGLQQYSGTSLTVKQQLLGEAYFIRAFWHFYLTSCYGAIPLITTTSYSVNNALSRTPRNQVLLQIIADLNQARILLNTNYVDASDTLTTTSRVRPNKAVATALLARVYLYMGNYSNDKSYYAKADSAASAVIANNDYSLVPLTNVFLANSSNTEAIWQLATPLPANYDTTDGETFILIAAPGPGGNSETLSPQLLNAFEPNDQRFNNWVGSITTGGTTYYFPYKYKNYMYEGVEYTVVLRLAEQYLIRAEAKVYKGDLPGAANDLNMIRTRAGLPNTIAANQNDLLTAILHERQVELFTEWGHRWFDLNRTGNTSNVMSVVTPSKGGTWNPNGYQELYPIPQIEINVDHNLTQNPGY